MAEETDIGGSAATSVVAPEPAVRPARLPGLWVVCVLFGLAGVVWFANVFLATPLGMAAFGLLAAANVAVAAWLWTRSRTAWLITLIFLLLKVAFGAAASTADPVSGVGALCLNLGIIAYLWFRRGHFGVAERPPVWRPSAVVALGLVLVLGTGWTLLFVVDDPRENFPELQVQTVRPPDSKNGYVVLQEMARKWPIESDDGIWQVVDKTPADLNHASAEWQGDAAKVAAKWSPCLAQVDVLLARPAFVVTDAPRTPAAVARGAMPLLAYTGRLGDMLALRCDLEISRGEAVAAAHDAGSIMRLGLLTMANNEGLMNFLTGANVLAVGMDELRLVAESDKATPTLLGPQIGRLEFGDALQAAAVRSLGTEFERDQLMLAGSGSPSALARMAPGSAPGLSAWRRCCVGRRSSNRT